MTIDNPVWRVNTAKSLNRMISEMASIENVSVKELQRLQDHADLLIQQATEIQSRVELTKHINSITIPFTIVKEKEYYLYEDDTISLIAPHEWSKGPAKTIRQLGDGSWEEVVAC